MLHSSLYLRNIFQASNASAGTKRSREGNNEAVLGQSPGKRLCRFSSEMLQVVRSDQVHTLPPFAMLLVPLLCLWQSL